MKINLPKLTKPKTIDTVHTHTHTHTHGDFKDKRNSNFELLRIILMIMIIILHYCNAGMGGALKNVPQGTANYYLIHFIESACIMAVNTFILITGYFMNQKKEIKVSKVLNLFYLSLVYGIIIFLGCILFGKITVNLSIIKKAILTITDRWFVVIYCILYLLIPYINKLIQSITKKQYTILLVVLIMFFYIWPTFWTKTTVKDGGYGIINFIILYLIGAYIRLYYNNFNSLSKSISVYIGCTIVTTIFSLVASRAWQYNSIFNLISAIALFEIFKSIDIKHSKFINKLATYTFSTYIIHENALIVSTLYRDIFKTKYYWNSKFLIIHLIISAIGIYVLCVFIEFIRRLIMKKYIDSFIEKIDYKIN